MGDDDDERRLRGRAALVLLGLIIILVLVDVFGRLLVDPSFRVSDLMMGTLIGAFLLLVGIDISHRWPFGPDK